MLEPNFQQEDVDFEIKKRNSNMQLKVRKQFAGGFRKSNTKQQPQLQIVNFSIKSQQKQVQTLDVKLKTEYGGGFRKFQPKIQPQSVLKNSLISKRQLSNNQQILNYVQKINVQNLVNLYQQTIQDTSRAGQQRFKQLQEQSVVRLYKNLYPKKQKTQQSQQNKEQNKQNKKYAQDLWKEDKKYQKEPDKYIVKRQLQKIHKKFEIQLNGVCKRKKIQLKPSFKQIFICFLIQQYENILNNSDKTFHTQSHNEDSEVKLLYLWKGFISTINLKSALKKYQNGKISKQLLQKLKKNNKYLYCIIKNLVQIPNKLFSFEELKTIISDDLLIPVQQLIFQFQPKNEYTSPLCMEPQKQEKKTNKKRFVEVPVQQEIKTIKANPVPKSTYQKPDTKDKPSPKKTKIDPFNLTDKSPLKTYDEYYHFQRDFKAQPVPSSTYKPHRLELLSQQQIKARAQLNLQKSKYPKTMQENLRNYKRQKQTRARELSKKYQKVRQGATPKQIPDFEYLHAEQLIIQQKIKQNNKNQIKVVPFKLSENKQIPRATIDNYINSPQIHEYKPIKQPKYQSKSTQKFDAYVEFRKRYENQKMRKFQDKQKQKQLKQKQKKQYKQILKDRMSRELQDQRKAENKYDCSMPGRIKVDRQKIYRERPLLMQGNQDQKEYDLPWDPIF